MPEPTAETAATLTIGWIDWTVVGVYVLGIVGLGCWAGWRRRGAEGSGYFLAGKSLTWPIIGLALFSTNISTLHLVSLAQSGHDTGLAMGNFEWMAAFTLICLALFFAPFYIRSQVTTLPDFLEKRYCRPCRDWFAGISILSAIFIHLGFSLYTGAVVLEGFLLVGVVDDPEQYRLLTIIAIAGITGLYTIIGGLMAVVLTESVQTIVLLIGSISITVIGYNAVGGWEGMQSAIASLASESPEAARKVGNHLSILRPHGDASDLPWYSVLLGYPVLGLWYWCADQTIVQRVLGAKDENHARVGPLFAGFIKILPVFIFVLPGVICLALIQQGKLPQLPLTSQGQPNSEHTLDLMITELLPVGLKGVMAAALLAALMSTVSGALNSIATLFSYDLFKRWRPETSDRTLVRVGRAVTFCAMVAAILWSPWVGQFGSIFKGINQVIGYVAPPVTALFIWGVFVRRLSATAALTTAWFGTLLGMVIFALDWFQALAGWEQTYHFHTPFLMIPVYLFAACSAVLILVSLSRKLAWGVAGTGTALGLLLAWSGAGEGGLLEPWRETLENPCVMVPLFLFCTSSAVFLLVFALVPKQQTPDVEGLVWKNPLEALRGESWRGLGDYRVLAGLLFVVMIFFYWTCR